MKIVDFKKCVTCAHYELSEAEDVCNDCMNCPAREDSHTPINYEEKK